MGHRDDLLAEINQGLPPGIDWKAGARAYVQRAMAGDAVEWQTAYSLTKPLYRLNPGSDMRGFDQAVHYLINFTNIFKLLRLQGGARIMDVACGAGWMSHYFTKLGYRTFGFDIAADFIDLAKRRLTEDPHLSVQADEMFAVIDIEAESPGPAHFGAYDAIVLESCLHHFFDPISALSNLAPCLSEAGVMLIFEGENRSSDIKPEYMAEMVNYHTIERPYRREHLIEVLREAGLPHFEFLGQVNGLFSPKEAWFRLAGERVIHTQETMNVCLCARNPEAISRVLPGLGTEAPVNDLQPKVDYLLARERELVSLVRQQADLIGSMRGGFLFHLAINIKKWLRRASTHF